MKLQATIYRSTGSRDRKNVYQKYMIPYRKGMTVLDVIFYIQKYVDPTLAYRYECRQGICGTCGVMYNHVPVLSCSTQIDQRAKEHVIEPLENFPIEKDLIVNLKPILKRYLSIKPYLEKIHQTMLTKTAANASKPFRKCIECGCCIAGSPTMAKHKGEILDPMDLVKIARYISDPRDRGNRKTLALKKSLAQYSTEESRKLASLCPRGVPIDRAVDLLKK